MDGDDSGHQLRKVVFVLKLNCHCGKNRKRMCMNKKTIKRNRKEGSRVGEEETLPLDNKIGINQYDEKQLQRTDNQYLYFSKIPLLLKKKKTLTLDLRKKRKTCDAYGACVWTGIGSRIFNKTHVFTNWCKRTNNRGREHLRQMLTIMRQDRY